MTHTKKTTVAMALALLGIATASAQQPGAPAMIKGTTQTKPQFVPRAPALPQAQAAPQALPDGSIPSEIGPAMELVVGKSTLVRLPAPIERISVGNPAVADVTLISARELYLLGKTFGSTNVIM